MRSHAAAYVCSVLLFNLSSNRLSTVWQCGVAHGVPTWTSAGVKCPRVGAHHADTQWTVLHEQAASGQFAAIF